MSASSFIAESRYALATESIDLRWIHEVQAAKIDVASLLNVNEALDCLVNKRGEDFQLITQQLKQLLSLSTLPDIARDELLTHVFSAAQRRTALLAGFETSIEFSDRLSNSLLDDLPQSYRTAYESAIKRLVTLNTVLTAMVELPLTVCLVGSASYRRFDFRSAQGVAHHSDIDLMIYGDEFAFRALQHSLYANLGASYLKGIHSSRTVNGTHVDGVQGIIAPFGNACHEVSVTFFNDRPFNDHLQDLVGEKDVSHVYQRLFFENKDVSGTWEVPSLTGKAISYRCTQHKPGIFDILLYARDGKTLFTGAFLNNLLPHFEVFKSYGTLSSSLFNFRRYMTALECSQETTEQNSSSMRANTFLDCHFKVERFPALTRAHYSSQSELPPFYYQARNHG